MRSGLRRTATCGPRHVKRAALSVDNSLLDRSAGVTLGKASYVPLPVAEMHAVLGSLEEFLRAAMQLPPLVRFGYVHYQFEAVHPLADGNGRIRCLLITLLPCAWNLLPEPLLRTEGSHRFGGPSSSYGLPLEEPCHNILFGSLRGLAEVRPGRREFFCHTGKKDESTTHSKMATRSFRKWVLGTLLC